MRWWRDCDLHCCFVPRDRQGTDTPRLADAARPTPCHCTHFPLLLSAPHCRSWPVRGGRNFPGALVLSAKAC